MFFIATEGIFFSMQAATGNSAIPNPFMSSEGDLFAPVAAAVAAAPAGSTVSPPRPPPASGQTTPAATASPAKSAFDDLNDSIRMALGGSPSHPPAPAQQQAQTTIPQQQQPQQPLFNTFDMGGQPTAGGFMAGMGIPAGNVGFGSPAKQNAPVAGRLASPPVTGVGI